MPEPTPASGDQSHIPPLLSHPAVHKHLDILQGIINRLAQNSVTCKNWCITIVAGVLVLAFSKDVQDGAKKLVPYIVALPIVIFWLLDSYYHALEKCFRGQGQALVDSIHDGTFSPATVLVINTKHSRAQAFRSTLRIAFTSAAAAGFYLALVGAVIVVWLLIC
jgi:hypothetical protein